MDYKHMKGGIYYICVVHTYRYIYMYAKSIDKHVQSVLHTDVHTVEHSYNKPEIPGQSVCYKQEFVISEQFPIRY